MIRSLVSKSATALRALMTRRIVTECDGIPYYIENASLAKILNWIGVEASCLLGLPRPWGLPTHLQIEPSTLCNLKCALCPVTQGLGRAAGNMSTAMFRKLMDEVGDYLLVMLLWDWGEPFLNPSLYEIIACAKERGIITISSTNGHLFAGRDGSDRAERVVRSGLDSLVFAVDGITQVSYQEYRKGGNLETVIESIRNVVEAKRRLGSATPLTILRFIVMRQNEHEVPRLKDFARSLGVDVLALRNLLPYDDGNTCATEEDGGRFVPFDPLYRRFRHDPENGDRIRRKRNPCKSLWNCPSIHWDGDIAICTFDPYGKCILGNVTRDDFHSVWFSDRYCSLRRRFRRNYRTIPHCSECTNAFEGGSCNTEESIGLHFLQPR